MGRGCAVAMLAGLLVAASPAGAEGTAKRRALPATIRFDPASTATRIALADLGRRRAARLVRARGARARAARLVSAANQSEGLHEDGRRLGGERFSRVLFQPYPGRLAAGRDPGRAAVEAAGHGQRHGGRRQPVADRLFPRALGSVRAAHRTSRRSASRWSTRSARRRSRCAGSPWRRCRPATRCSRGCRWSTRWARPCTTAWPGKARSVEDLRAAWQRGGACVCAGRTGGCAATAASRTRRRRRPGSSGRRGSDGRWWFVDPRRPPVPVARRRRRPARDGTPGAGREAFFSEPPPAGLVAGARARRRPRPLVLHLEPAAPVRRDWIGGWMDLTFRRMDAWGLNTVANWSDPRLWDGEAQAVRGPAGELGHRSELSGAPGRLLRGLRQGGRRAGAAAVRAAARRPVAARLFPGERAAVPAEGTADRGADPRRAARRRRALRSKDGWRRATREERRKEFVGRRLRPLRRDHQRRGAAGTTRTT